MLAPAPGSDGMRGMAGLLVARAAQLTGTRRAMAAPADQHGVSGVGRRAESFADGTPVSSAFLEEWTAADACVLDDGRRATAIAGDVA